MNIDVLNRFNQISDILVIATLLLIKSLKHPA